MMSVVCDVSLFICCFGFIFVLCFFFFVVFFFFFKQKTAYEMRISDWSSDVCSSDLLVRGLPLIGVALVIALVIGAFGYLLASFGRLWRKIAPNTFLAELLATLVRFVFVVLGIVAGRCWARPRSWARCWAAPA